jgi:hypothetical protein
VGFLWPLSGAVSQLISSIAANFSLNHLRGNSAKHIVPGQEPFPKPDKSVLLTNVKKGGGAAITAFVANKKNSNNVINPFKISSAREGA